MDIFKKKFKNGFTTVGNDVFKAGLSAKAIGILCTMFSLPDDWKFSEVGLISIFQKDGQTSIRSGLKELEEKGFLKRTRIREKGKIVGVEWLIADSPEFKEPCDDLPLFENPSVANQPQLNKNKQNKNKQNKYNPYNPLKGDVGESKKRENKSKLTSPNQRCPQKRDRQDSHVQELLQAYAQDAQTLDKLNEWLKVREEKKVPATATSIQKNLEQLERTAKQSGLSVNNYLDQIIMRGWAGFFPIPQTHSLHPKTWGERLGESEPLHAGKLDHMAKRNRPLVFIQQT